MLVSICFVPMMKMFTSNLEEIAYMDDMHTAMYLAKEEIEKVKNLSLSLKQVKALGNVISPTIYLNKDRWRTARIIERASDPLKLTVYVFKEEAWGVPLFRLVTLVKK